MGRPAPVLLAMIGRLLVPWLVRAADAANRAAEWERAERLYARVLAIRPDMAAIRVQYGHALKEQGFLHRAAAAYRQAAGAAPDPTDAWIHLGHVCNLLDRPSEAAAAFAAALVADARAPGALEELDRLRALPQRSPSPEAAAIALVLEAHDLAPTVADRLDAAFYRSHYSALADAATPVLLGHFGRVGVAALAPLNAREAFDPAFYVRTYRDDRPLAPARAYRHWLNIGARRGWCANKAVWLDRWFGAAVATLGRDARRYAEAVLAIEAASTAARPFGWLAAARGPSLPPLSAMAEGETWALLARGLTGAGRPDDAAALLSEGRRRWPDHAALRGDAAEGADADRRGWTGAAYADAAAARAARQDWSGALALLGAGVRARPEDADLRHLLLSTADRAIHATWRAAEAIAATPDGMDRARAMLDAVLVAAIDAQPTTPPLPRRPITAVAIIGNADLPQCRFYRIDQKLEHCDAAGLRAEFFDERTDVPRFMAGITRFQAAIFYRVPAHMPVIDAILAARALGIVTIFEIDDLLFDGRHYPAPLETYGGQLSATDHRGLALAVPMYARAMALCDVGLASTDTLAEAMRPHLRSGRVFVHRNGLGRPHRAAASAAAAQPPRDGARLTILFGSHTKAHKADFDTLAAPALLALAARHDALSIVLVGFVTISPALRPIADRISLVGPLSLDDYWALLATADISLAPLLASPATDAKSEIKWLEAAMLGVPSVLSRTATYAEAVEDGVTGLLCDTPADWTAALDRLACDPGLRRAIGDRAREAAVARYGPKQGARSLRRIVEALAPAAQTRKPRVLIVNVFYPPQLYGGATRVVHDNVRDLRARHGVAFDLDVLATLDASGEPHAVRTGVIDGTRVTTIASPAPPDEMAFEDAAMERAFRDHLAATKPDLIHFHSVQRLTASVVAAARDLAIPYLITMHDGWWISPRQFLVDAGGAVETYDYRDPAATLARFGPYHLRRLLRLAPLLDGARAVLTVSDAFAAVCRSAGVPKVRSIPNGVSPVPSVARQPNATGRVRLGYLGGFYAHKGWPLIEAALEDWQDDAFSLLAVDHGRPAGTSHRETWRQTPVEIRGKCPPDEIADLYGAIDVLLAPSIWPESFGLVTREALRCGCWVVASDRGDIGGDIVADVNGFRIDVSGPEGLRAALARLSADPERFRRSPPPASLRTSVDQADDLAAIYRSILIPPSP